MIPDSFIQELLRRIDIVDLIDAYLPLRRAGADHVACCPFHSEKTPSFTVSPAKQFYHCFGCGAHGTAIGFLMEYSGLDFVEAVKELAARAGMPLPEDDRTPRDGPKIRAMTEIMARATQYYYEQLKHSGKAIAYLKQRGVSGE
ncbi:MAG: DNA primase, partial [Candidatus Accumulibacter sp.]|nr:DNA primase [Accumulibacter sp.]